MKTKIFLVASVLFVSLTMGLMIDVQAQSRGYDNDSYCVIARIPPDKIPFPRAYSANTVFELASDGTYILTGTIVNVEGRPYFKIDFDKQPWLATKARLADPYFEISSSDIGMVSRYQGQLVQMAVVARSNLVLTTNPTRNNISLDLIVAPEFLK